MTDQHRRETGPQNETHDLPHAVHRPRALIVCHSHHHGNTRAVAEVMAAVLGADVVAPEDVEVGALTGYDLIGFGSGIYFGVVHPDLLEVIDRLPPGEGRAAFTFSTSGMFVLPWLGTSGVKDRLRDHGYRVLGDFNCRGLDTVGLLTLIGGVNKGHPDHHDFGRATRFAHDLLAQVARDRTPAQTPTRTTLTT